MKKEFKVLSLEELEQITSEERRGYFAQFKDILLDGLEKMSHEEQISYYYEYLIVLLDELDKMTIEGQKNYYTEEFRKILQDEYERIINIRKQLAKDEFKVLSAKEEQKLTKEELDKYYRAYREYVLNRKRTNTSPGIDTVAPKLVEPTVKIAQKIIPMFTCKDVIHEWEGTENIPEGTVIFADTHQGLLDNFIAIPETLRHAPILHGREVNPLLLGCQLNTGWVGVIKGDKVNNNNAKLDMVNLLLKGISVRYFPEGTWNLSPNKLHLPMSWGIIDTAKKAGVPIVPVAHEFVYEERNGKLVITKIYSKYGKPIYVPIEADLSEKLEELSTAFATMKFELIEKATLKTEESITKVVVDENGNKNLDVYFERNKISNAEYIKWLEKQYKDLKLGKLNWPKEQEYIFRAKDESNAFTYANEPDFNKNGDFLPHPEIRRLDEIEMMHRIRNAVSGGINYDSLQDAFQESTFDPGYKRVLKPGEKKLSKKRRAA